MRVEELVRNIICNNCPLREKCAYSSCQALASLIMLLKTDESLIFKLIRLLYAEPQPENG